MPRGKIPGNIERLKDCYRVRLSVAGERHYFTLPTTVRADAVAFAKKKYHELSSSARQRAAAGIEGRMRFSALLETFEEEALPPLAKGAADAYRDSLKPIRTYFVQELEDPRLESIHAKHIESFLTWRRVHRGVRPRSGRRTVRKSEQRTEQAPAKRVSNQTLAKDCAVLHRIFAFAARRQYVDSNPVARTEAPKVDKHDPVILSPADYEKLLDACGDDRPMLRLYVLALGETGMRCESEALWLRWEDVDLAEGFIWIASGRGGHRTKSGRGRWAPMTDRLAKAMKDHFASYHFATYGSGDDAHRSPWIFHHLTTWRRHVAGARIVSLRNSFEAAAARAQLPDGFRQHDLRHRRVTVWLAEEKSAVLVQEAMGHSDLRTTLGYSHLARTHLKALVSSAPVSDKQDHPTPSQASAS
jgi:site-specific recombinase XerD